MGDSQIENQVQQDENDVNKVNQNKDGIDPHHDELKQQITNDKDTPEKNEIHQNDSHIRKGSKDADGDEHEYEEQEENAKLADSDVIGIQSRLVGSSTQKQADYYEKSIVNSAIGSQQQKDGDNDHNDQQKTFLTQQKKGEPEAKLIWKPYDFLFPGGRLSKLVKVMDVYAKNFPFSEIINKLKIAEGYPVINLIGASVNSSRGKFFAGLARSAFNCDAVIVDSATETGLEPYTIRKDLMLIGVAPENGTKFPKINPTSKDPHELSNGHTHIFLVNDKEKTLEWSQETLFKMQLVLKLAEGKVSRKAPRCKIVNVLLGDTPHYLDEVRLAVKYDLPIIVVKGSPVCDEIIRNSLNEEDTVWEIVEPEMQELLTKGHFYMLDSIDSEDIAQMIHFFLTFTPY